MIKRKGDLFTTDAPAIGHGVNCQGVMGAGIAVAVKNQFPKNYLAYKTNCDLKFLQPGESFLYHENSTYVFNMATQFQPGPDAQYKWVLKSGLETAEQAVRFGVYRVAIPMIGCGIGGLQWEVVEHLLTSVELSFQNFQWEVWKL